MFKRQNQTLYLIRGVPGSGKSTFANQLLYQGVVHQVLEADKYFIDGEGKYNFDPSKLRDAHEWCQARTKRYLLDVDSVAVANTSTTEKKLQFTNRLQS